MIDPHVRGRSTTFLYSKRTLIRVDIVCFQEVYEVKHNAIEMEDERSERLQKIFVLPFLPESLTDGSTNNKEHCKAWFTLILY